MCWTITPANKTAHAHAPKQRSHARARTTVGRAPNDATQPRAGLPGAGNPSPVQGSPQRGVGRGEPAEGAAERGGDPVLRDVGESCGGGAAGRGREVWWGTLVLSPGRGNVCERMRAGCVRNSDGVVGLIGFTFFVCFRGSPGAPNHRWDRPFGSCTHGLCPRHTHTHVNARFDHRRQTRVHASSQRSI